LQDDLWKNLIVILFRLLCPPFFVAHGLDHRLIQVQAH
jgi:hypothetical protein